MKINVWVESFFSKREIMKKIRDHGLVIEKNKPDFVITYGGDGTILEAERKYPGVPKIPVKKSMLCSKCVSYDINDMDKIIDSLKNNIYEIRKYVKLEAVKNGKKLTALNEIQVRSEKPCKAIRLFLKTNNRKYNNIIGDGIIVSTPYGSTGYYRSIGYEPFNDGIRIGFNNVYPKPNSVLFKNSAKVKVLRENGLIVADNSTKMIKIKPEDTVLIKESKQRAKFVEIK